MQPNILKYKLIFYRFTYFLTFIYINCSLALHNGFWHKKRQSTHDILCFGGITTHRNKENNWVTHLSRLLNQAVADLSEEIYTNELIVEKVLSLQLHNVKPKAIFILFEEIDNVCVYLNHKKSITCNFEEIKSNNQLSSIKENIFFPYHKMYNIHTILFRFIRNLDYVVAFCESNNIEMYCSISSKILKYIPLTAFKKNTQQRLIKNISSLNKEKFNKNLAQAFIEHLNTKNT